MLSDGHADHTGGPSYAHPPVPGPGWTPVNMSPESSAMPTTNIIQSLANGLDSWALIAAMVGVVIGAVIWGCTQLTIRKPPTG